MFRINNNKNFPCVCYENKNSSSYYYYHEYVIIQCSFRSGIDEEIWSWGC